MIKRLFCLFSLALVFSSCVSKKEIVYFGGIDSSQSSTVSSNYEAKLQADDMLLIIVSAPDPEAAIPYNLIAFSTGENSSDKTTSGGIRYQTYLIDNAGNIEFPVLGKLKLGGLSKTEAVEKIKDELKKYITSPIVNMRIVNYKVSVMGEVVRPSSYTIQSERITLPEALSLAGDLTIFGNRKNILVIREMDGIKTHNFIDITSADFINSPFYYLDQNDIIYVEPNKTKVNSSAVGPNVTATISAVSLLITIVALLIR